MNNTYDSNNYSRIMRRVRECAQQSDRDGLRRVFEAVCAAAKTKERQSRMIELLVWVLPDDELDGVLEAADAMPPKPRGRAVKAPAASS